MENYLKVEFFGDAADGIKQLATITERNSIEVVCDALSIYEWILQQQTLDRAVVSLNGGPSEEVELEKFVVHKDVAQRYLFKQT